MSRWLTAVVALGWVVFLLGIARWARAVLRVRRELSR